MAKRQRRRRQERRHEHAKREGRRTRHSVITGVGVTAGAVLGLASPAMADQFVVDSNLDNGDGTCATGSCTLRDAVYDANSSGNNSKIFFDSSLSGQTIVLDGTSLYLNHPTSIYGLGADQLTVDAQYNSRIFTAQTGYAGDRVLISGLTLTHGAAQYGGAIYDVNSDLTVIDSHLTGNIANFGGAITEAGGYYNGSYTLVAYSTLDDNVAFGSGGAIVGQSSFGLIGGSTLEGNQAGDVGGGVAAGGGYLFDSTISGNQAGTAVGGVYSAVYDVADDTIVANNNAPVYRDGFANAYFGGYYDLVEHPDGQTISGSGQLTGVDPQLGGLGDNGGSTPTLKPAASSPVVDKGSSDVDFDQRGFPRTVDNPFAANAPDDPATQVVPNGTDIGSVELSLAEGPQAPPQPVTTPSTFNLKKAIKKCKKKYPKGKKRKKCIKKAKKKAGVLSARSADGPTPAERADQLRRAWRAERGHRLRRGRSGESSPGFKGGLDWPDHAWKIPGPTPKP